jgi:hypothetical protein
MQPYDSAIASEACGHVDDAIRKNIRPRQRDVANASRSRRYDFDRSAASQRDFCS